MTGDGSHGPERLPPNDVHLLKNTVPNEQVDQK